MECNLIFDDIFGGEPRDKFFDIVYNANRNIVENELENLFIELSGPILDDLLLTASILSCDMADMGFEILPVRVKFAKETKYGRSVRNNL